MVGYHERSHKGCGQHMKIKGVLIQEARPTRMSGVRNLASSCGFSNHTVRLLSHSAPAFMAICAIKDISRLVHSVESP